MRRRATIFALLSILAPAIPGPGVSASAETLRCQSVNGNLNCAGSSGTSCQTVDGKKVCTSGHGEVVQSFGSGESSHDDVQTDDADDDPAWYQHLEKQDRQGHKLLLQRDGRKLHLHTDWLSLERK